MDRWWDETLRDVFGGRKVVVAGAVAAAWNAHVETLRRVGAADVFVVATEGRGLGPVPDVRTVTLEPPATMPVMQRIHHGIATLADPPAEVRAELDDFDPTGEAVVVGSFFNTAPELAGRPFLAHRRPAWVALEDKTVIDAFWDRARIRHRPSVVVPITAAPSAAVALDAGAGTVWAADARDGFHGGTTGTRWVADDGDAVVEELGAMCSHVRVMPFVEGIPCAVHGMVLPDGVAVFRPVEMVVLRRGRQLVYAGCATFWDPPDAVRSEMRAVARAAGRQLATEVGFRGAFTVDGVVDGDGFWPTELNPRFGAGLMTIARATDDFPVLLLNDLVVAGQPIGRTADELERELVACSDDRRGGGTWRLGLGTNLHHLERPAAFDVTGWRWAADDEDPSAHVIAGDDFVRTTYVDGGIPIGPPTAPLAVAFWDFVDRELGAGTAGLTAPRDPFA